VAEELNLLAEIIKRKKEENYQTKKLHHLNPDLEEDCPVTESEHLQTEFILTLLINTWKE
jgi:hypothetical protein